MRICKKCNLEKDISEFKKWKAACKSCLNEYRKIWDKERSDEQKLKDKIRRQKKYYSNKEIFAERSRNQRNKNIERYKEKDRERYLRDPEKFKNYHKEYYSENKEILLARIKEYNSREDIKNRRRNYEREYSKRKRKEDDLYNFKYMIRSFISSRFKGWKSMKTEEILGCSFEDFKKHIESKFADPYKLNLG